MTTAKRRSEILDILKSADTPVTAGTLAGRFGVSRQVIVQDMAVIRTAQPEIISTTRGYVLSSEDSGCTREFKVRHLPEEIETELGLITDCGGHVKNISISHRAYGRISADMDISSRQDIAEFMESLKGSQSSPLSSATNGYHYHLVEAANTDRLDLIEKKLKEAGFLAPLTPWESEGSNS